MKHLPLLLLALSQLVFLAVLIPVFLRNRAMKRKQNAIVEQIRGKRFWRINLVSPAFFQRMIRIMPFEAKGVLIEEEDSFRIKGFWLKSGSAFESNIPKKDCTVEWLGNKTLRAGNLHWARLTTPKGPIQFCADTGMYALPSREALADIFRSAFSDYPLTSTEKSDFALEKNPRSLIAVVLFLGLLLFSLLDSFVFSKYELVESQLGALASNPAILLSVPVGLMALAVVLYQLFIRGDVPARESLVLAMMLSAVVLGSALPMLKRVDQALADSPSQDYAYVVTRVGRLEPADPSVGLPKMRFLRANEYWEQFPAGSTYAIPLLRGSSGLWQLDHNKFDAPVIAYYEKHDNGK